MCTANGANNNNVNKTNTLCVIAEIWLTAPALIFVAVLAIAPVAGIPPRRGVITLAIPCPTNSLLELCLLPVIPSETTADNNDSIPPGIAITNAGCQRYLILSKLICGNFIPGKDC